MPTCHWPRGAHGGACCWEVVESPSLEIFQTRLDKVLCSQLWVTLLRQGVGLGDPQRSLPTLTILSFCVAAFCVATKIIWFLPCTVLFRETCKNDAALQNLYMKFGIHIFKSLFSNSEIPNNLITHGKKKYLFTVKSLQGKYLGRHIGYKAAVHRSECRAEPGTGRPAFWSCLAYDLQSILSRPRLVRSHPLLGQSTSVSLQGCVHQAALPTRSRLC